jgi:hypothetical protein
VHAGVNPDPVSGAILTPIYQSTTYIQDSVDSYLDKGCASTAHSQTAPLPPATVGPLIAYGSVPSHGSHVPSFPGPALPSARCAIYPSARPPAHTHTHTHLQLLLAIAAYLPSRLPSARPFHWRVMLPITLPRPPAPPPLPSGIRIPGPTIRRLRRWRTRLQSSRRATAPPASQQVSPLCPLTFGLGESIGNQFSCEVLIPMENPKRKHYGDGLLNRPLHPPLPTAQDYHLPLRNAKPCRCGESKPCVRALTPRSASL